MELKFQNSSSLVLNPSFKIRINQTVWTTAVQSLTSNVHQQSRITQSKTEVKLEFTWVELQFQSPDNPNWSENRSSILYHRYQSVVKLLHLILTQKSREVMTNHHKYQVYGLMKTARCCGDHKFDNWCKLKSTNSSLTKVFSTLSQLKFFSCLFSKCRQSTVNLLKQILM